MADTTKIEWADATWNPVTGCTEVSPGCDHCYAKTFAERWRGIPGHHFENGFDIQLRPDKLSLPLTWRKPRKVFVNSMSDLFHKDVPDDYIARVFAVMAATPQHTYQILTKRHGRMRSLLNTEAFVHQALDLSLEILPVQHGALPHGDTWPLPNVWLGVSVETQQWADIRIPALLMTPAAVRFLSCEPLLGPLDLTRIAYTAGGGTHLDVVNGRHGVPDLWTAPAKRIDWAIVGGESGRRARPMHPDWAGSLRDQCTQAGVPFFFKQWGEWAPAGRGIGMAQHAFGREVLVGQPLDDMGHRQVMRRVGKHAAGRELDGRTHNEFPAVTT